MSYSKSIGVAALCYNILSGSTDFSTISAPTLAQVEMWMSSGCSIIESTLTTWGYSVPPAQSSVIYDLLADLNTLYAAARAELSRTNITIGLGERTRGQVFLEMFWDELNRLKGQDLTGAGLSFASGTEIYVGGVSVDEKQTQESDTDRVTPRLFRGFGAFSGTIRPDATTASALDD